MANSDRDRVLDYAEWTGSVLCRLEVLRHFSDPAAHVLIDGLIKMGQEKGLFSRAQLDLAEEFGRMSLAFLKKDHVSRWDLNQLVADVKAAAATIRNRQGPERAYGWLYCNHANETPRGGVCECYEDCICRIEGNCPRVVRKIR